MTATWVLYPLFCAALYYLGAHAKATQFLWSRYPAWLDRLTMCAACSGFWYGIACGALGWQLDAEFLGLPARSVPTVAAVGLCSLVWTPLLAVAHLWALATLAPDEEETP